MKAEITDLETYFPNLNDFEHKKLFENIDYPWEALQKTAAYIKAAVESARSARGSNSLEGVDLMNRSLRLNESILFVNRLVEIKETTAVEGTDILFEKGVVLEPGAMIKSPAIFGAETEIRQGAYVRGSVITGERCTIGHATEVKNSVFMNHTEAGHFAYIGDSILGSYVNLGAGTKLANLQLRKASEKINGRFPSITLSLGGERLKTNLSKIGAVIGDHCETGCNSVTSPGVFLGAHCWVFANTTVRKEYYPRKSIIR